MKRKQQARGAPLRFSLANWPVSIRLAALFVLASLMGLVFGGLRIAGAVNEAGAYAKTTQLAVLGEQVTAFAQALEDERDLTAGVAALTTLSRAAASDQAAPPVAAQLSRDLTEEQASLSTAQRATSSAARLTAARASGVGPAFPSSVQAAAAGVIAQARNLTALRAEAAGRQPAAVIGDYSDALANLFALNDEITSTGGDAQLADEARALGALSRAKDQASQQRAILVVALIESGLNDAGNGQPATADPAGRQPYNNIGGAAALAAAGGMQALIIARSLQLTDVMSFQSAATAAQESAYLAAMAGPRVAAALKIGALVTATGDPRAAQRSSPGVTAATAPGVWYRDMSAMIGGMRSIESAVAGALVTRSELLQHKARRSALLTAGVTVAAVLLMLAATALVGRSLLRPLRRLQADALEIAAVRLPARVAAAMGTDPGEASGSEVEPIGVRSTDEIGKVARAFDQVHAEAVRLAGTEAQLRGNLNAMFISLSRRSVPLIERLARMIDSLEQNEGDPEQLANLFAMDHLVTRMRRNSENLLVLGGEEPVRKWSGPVPLSDVTHAAAAEIEQYGRVVLTVQPGIVVSGQAAADTVHLLAELIENATLFSPRDTQVQVSAREMGRGGVAIEVSDYGVGVSASRLADMNWRLDQPPVIDVSVSRHMGLFAVSRLAARHGIRVRLRAGTPQGLSALVWLPASITRRDAAPGAGMRFRRPAGTAGQRALAGQRARATTAWFAARAPSGRPAPPGDTSLEGRGAPATGLPGTGSQEASPDGRSHQIGYGDWNAPGADVQADTQAQGRQTPAGLPQRVPRAAARDAARAAARDAAPVLSAPVLSRQEASPQAGLARRSPEAARSRLAGFQRGSREAMQDREATEAEREPD